SGRHVDDLRMARDRSALARRAPREQVDVDEQLGELSLCGHVDASPRAATVATGLRSDNANRDTWRVSRSRPGWGGCVRRLAIFVVHRRWWVIFGAIVAIPLMALYGGGVQSRLSNGGFEDPGAESAQAASAIKRDFPASGQTDFVVLVGATQGTVKDA